MKMKHTKTIAKLLIKIGYADYYITTRNKNGEVVGYAVCWSYDDEYDDDWYDDEKHYITLFDDIQPSREGILQAHALEDHFAWNQPTLWDESERITMRPVSAGKYSLYERRLDRIKYCVKETTKNET